MEGSFPRRAPPPRRRPADNDRAISIRRADLYPRFSVYDASQTVLAQIHLFWPILGASAIWVGLVFALA